MNNDGEAKHRYEVPNSYIEELVAESRAVIACAAAEGRRAITEERFVILLLDMSETPQDPTRVQQVFDASVQGRSAASPITMRHALGIVSRTAPKQAEVFAQRLAKMPPPGFIHTLVLSSVFGRLVVLYAPIGNTRFEA